MKALSFATILATGIAGAAFAQNASIKIAPLSVEGLVIGQEIKVDADFVAKYGVTAPVPFSFTVPTNEGQNIFFLPAPGGAGIVKVTFATPDEKVKSNLQFVHMTSPQLAPDERLKFLEDIAMQAFVASVPDPDRASIDVSRHIEIGVYPAVEMIGLYWDEKYGRIIIRVVGIFAPSGNRVLIAKSRTVVAGMPVPGVNEMNGTFVGRILESVKFLASRDENGNLVTF